MVKNKNGSQSQEPNMQTYLVDKSIHERRAKEFQAGLDPLDRTPFEKDLIRKEATERWNNKKHYIHGIQGVDGGQCSYEDKNPY